MILPRYAGGIRSSEVRRGGSESMAARSNARSAGYCQSSSRGTITGTGGIGNGFMPKYAGRAARKVLVRKGGQEEGAKKRERNVVTNFGSRGNNSEYANIKPVSLPQHIKLQTQDLADLLILGTA